jgi:hypothetical protein
LSAWRAEPWRGRFGYRGSMEVKNRKKPAKQMFVTALKHIKMMDPAVKQI